MYCAAAAGVTPVQIKLGSVKQLILPLKSGEKCSFSLSPGQSVRQLISSIREEDPEASSVVITDMKGHRISHLSKIGELKNNFHIRVDDRVYEVKLNADIEEEMSVLSNSEVLDLCTKAYYRKIRQRLADDNRHHIPYNEYLQWCFEYGLTEGNAKDLSKALHLSGDIVHFRNNKELKDFLFLRPEQITNAVTHALELKYMKIGSKEYRAQLEKVLDEYVALDTEKKLYDKKAQSSSTVSMYGIFGYLIAQFGILAHMVWIDFNWDIMEPVTYFVFLSTVIVGYTFFVKYSQEFTYDALKDRQRKKALRRLYLKNDFNWRRWDELDKEVRELTHKLGAANVPKKLSDHYSQHE